VILVVGLGNPGPRYQATRHNIGFRAVDRLVERHGSVGFRSRFEGEIAQFDRAGERVVVLKPMTFMNRSGHSVRPAMAFFKLSPEALLVVHDELDLALGDIRLKVGGGEAGHNGLRSISEQLGTSAYGRLRCGIGRAQGGGGTVADYVLDGFSPADQTLAEQMVDGAVEALVRVIEDGISAAMNQTNRRSKS